MDIISKQDVLNSFQNKKRKRNNLLFEYYKDSLFFKGLTAEYIADKISQDLGIDISASIIYKINHRIIKHEAPKPSVSTAASQSPDQNQNLQGKKGAEPLPSKNWEFKNADEYPNKNPLEDAFKGL